MHGVLINASGNLLAIQGNNQILLIPITEEMKAKLSVSARGEKVKCSSKIIQLGPVHSNELIKILFHPLSDSHLAVLTEDSLRLYHCTQSLEPEQRFFLKDVPISFSFAGSGYLDSWLRFTVFILLQNGDIFALCPVVPFDCLIPVEYISKLQEQARQDDLVSPKWLREIRGPSIKVDFSSPTGLKRVSKTGAMGKQKQKKSFTAVFDDEESDDAEEPVAETGFIRTKRPTGFEYVPSFQGPLNTADSNNGSKFEVSDILCLPTTPTVIVKSFEDGLMEIYLLFEDVVPKWTHETQFKKCEVSNTLILYERIDAGLPTYNKEMSICRLAPNTLSPPTTTYEFYAYHGAGIHRIKLPYVAVFNNSILSKDPLKLEKESIPTSSMTWLLNTLTLGNIKEARPVLFTSFTLITHQGRPYAMARDLEGVCHCVYDGFSMSSSKRLFDAESISQEQAITNQKLNLQFPNVTKVSNLRFEKESQAMLYLIDQTEERAKNQFVLLHKIDLQLKDQLRGIAESYAEQQAEITQCLERKALLEARYDKLDRSIAQVQAAQRDIIERANKVLHRTLLLQKTLSQAEMKFHEELISLKKQTNNHELEVEELVKQVRNLDIKQDSSAKQLSKPKDASLQQLLPILEKEGDILSSLVEQTSNLNVEVLKLYGLSVL